MAATKRAIGKTRKIAVKTRMLRDIGARGNRSEVILDSDSSLLEGFSPRADAMWTQLVTLGRGKIEAAAKLSVDDPRLFE